MGEKVLQKEEKNKIVATWQVIESLRGKKNQKTKQNKTKTQKAVLICDL